jgi:hypothetical protein
MRKSKKKPAYTPNDFRDLSAKFEPLSLLDWLRYNGLKKDKKYKKVYFGGFKVNCDSQRYYVFYRDLQCAGCSRKISYGILQQQINLGNNNVGAAHFNFYSGDGTLFTKDHIHPKSLGGSNRMENLQTMCCECNWKKGSSYYEFT